VGHPKLLDVSLALKIRVLNQIKNQVGWDADKPVHGVVYYLLFIQFITMSAKMLNKGNTGVV